ncbi:MAG TPA: ABC transporter permease [Dehalococcoidales bacterium]|nr:ABC transporter permease [Dehalococcoidales bacterium]
MSDISNSIIKVENNRPRTNELRRIWKVMFGRWVVTGGAVIILFVIIVAIFAPLLAPYDPDMPDLKLMLAQPSSQHLLGTDEVGRDVLSRVIFGSQISLLVGIVGVTIAGLIGITLGLFAGFFGGIVNNVIMRFIDALLSFPPLVLMLAIATVLGGGILNVLLALGIGMMPTYCRLMCAQVTSLRVSDYITASHSIGASNTRIMLHHLLPNAFPPLLVLITINLGTAIMMEASLSFLGIGILPPTATWGAMVSSGQRFIFTNPMLSFAPGVAILLVVLAFNMVGDGLRDALDPRLRGTL